MAIAWHGNLLGNHATIYRGNMEMFAFASAVRGYHVYQDVWKPSIGEKLVAKREFNNPMDQHALKIVKGGHLPLEFKSPEYCDIFLHVVVKSVIGRRRH